MFEQEKRLETAFAVRYHEDGVDKMLLKSRRGVKMFASYKGALNALSELGQSGEVINVCVNEVASAKPIKMAENSDVVGTLDALGKVLAEQDATFYKAQISTTHETNVVRHTPLGALRQRQPGDSSIYLDMHLQVCITN